MLIVPFPSVPRMHASWVVIATALLLHQNRCPAHVLAITGARKASDAVLLQMRLPATSIGILSSMWMILQGCDPVYWVGVRASLKEPIQPTCIEDTLHMLEGIDRVSIQKSEPTDAWYLSQAARGEQVPDRYMFEAGHQKGLITQFQKEGRTTLLAGVNGTGMTPPEDTIEAMQLFNARIAMQVAQACNAKYFDDDRFICLPDTAQCRETLRIGR